MLAAVAELSIGVFFLLLGVRSLLRRRFALWKHRPGLRVIRILEGRPALMTALFVTLLGSLLIIKGVRSMFAVADHLTTNPSHAESGQF